jgi:hypothetical protein
MAGICNFNQNRARSKKRWIAFFLSGADASMPPVSAPETANPRTGRAAAPREPDTDVRTFFP